MKAGTLERIRMLEEAGYHVSSLMKAYAVCIDFINRVSTLHGCCLCSPETCLRCEAKVILEQLGESDEKKD